MCRSQTIKETPLSYKIDKLGMKRPFHSGRGSQPISLVIIHYTAGHERSDEDTLRGGTDRQVSVHYLVGRHESYGIKTLVPEERSAWHAGKAVWTDHTGAKTTSINSISIGIEISNLGPSEPYTDFQYEATAQIARDLIARYPHITIDRFVGHNQVSPGRKVDPGPHWDWDRFRKLATQSARPLKIVLLADNSLIECHAQIENGTTRVDLRPVCNALKVELPSGAALEPFHPEVVQPGVTRVDLRGLVESLGWEVLTHRLAADSKIYLRKPDPASEDNEND